jgi:hypothetical protein
MITLFMAPEYFVSAIFSGTNKRKQASFGDVNFVYQAD